MPKMSYKGSFVETQRIKGKKSPKIEPMEMSAEKKKEMGEHLLAEQKAREAAAEKEPKWNFFCDLYGRKQEFSDGDYWKLYLENAAENVGAGDEEDRWNTLKDNFTLQETEGGLEEFDGVNHDEAKNFILVVHLPMLMRGHAV